MGRTYHALGSKTVSRDEGRLSSTVRSYHAFGPNSSLTRALADYIQPESYGAVADGVTDCTAAIRSAIADAVAASFPVRLRGGNYRITDTVDCYVGSVGVDIFGAGRNNTTITVDGGASTDGLRYYKATQYGRYGSLSNLKIAGASSATCRDLLVATNWDRLYLDKIDITIAGRHCFKSTGHQYLAADSCFFYVAGQCGVVLGQDTDVAPLGTTASFTRCTFDRCGTWGAQIRFQAWDNTFDGRCVFQSCNLTEYGGTELAADGGGLDVWDGVITMVAPYCEDNAGYDLLLGSSESTSMGARAVVINPTCNYGHDGIGNGHGGIFFKRAQASTLIGGQYGTGVDNPVLVATEADVAIHAYPRNTTLPKFKPDAGPLETLQRDFVGSPSQGRRFFASATWNPGLIAAGATATTTVTIPYQGHALETSLYPQLGDPVIVGFDTTDPGLILSGYVSTPCSAGPVAAVVTVTLYNATAGGITPASSTLNVQVIKR